MSPGEWVFVAYHLKKDDGRNRALWLVSFHQSSILIGPLSWSGGSGFNKNDSELQLSQCVVKNMIVWEWMDTVVLLKTSLKPNESGDNSDGLEVIFVSNLAEFQTYIK